MEFLHRPRHPDNPLGDFPMCQFRVAVLLVVRASPTTKREGPSLYAFHLGFVFPGWRGIPIHTPVSTFLDLQCNKCSLTSRAKHLSDIWLCKKVLLQCGSQKSSVKLWPLENAQLPNQSGKAADVWCCPSSLQHLQGCVMGKRIKFGTT